MPNLAICAACGAMTTQGATKWIGLLTTCGRGATNHRNTATLIRRAWLGQYPKKGRYGDAILHNPAGE